MESFELTFFCTKNDCNKNLIKIIEHQYEDFDIWGKKSIVELFCDVEKDFDEFRVSIFELEFTENNFKHNIQQLSLFVSSVYKGMSNFLFATGIYEITNYLTGSKKKIIEFDINFLKKFPIVFLRKGEDISLGKVMYRDENLTCIYYEKAQNMF